jgi:hypothetical protein
MRAVRRSAESPAAIARMKSLKAGLAGLARTLVFRWELAMIDGRKWRGHYPFLEWPDVFFERLRGFLAEVDSGTYRRERQTDS